MICYVASRTFVATKLISTIPQLQHRKSIARSAANYWKVARATINNIGDYRHGFNLKALGSAATAGARKEYMEQAKNGQSAP